MERSFKKDLLTVKIYATREQMGGVAAKDAIDLLKRLLAMQENVRVIFAAAPSQNEFLKELCSAKDVNWHRVSAFHMDEYVGINPLAPQAFGNFLRQRIFSRLPFGSVDYLNGNAQDINAECERYSALLSKKQIDIVFMGIGENGHIAFNDPPVADFADPYLVKMVKLDEICRNQQVNDGCFANINLVPTHALTLTVPMLAGAKHHLCIVPALTKATAVKNTIEGEITTAYPATILRKCKNATLYIEHESAKYLQEEY